MVHREKCLLCSSGNIGPELLTTDYFLSREIYSLFRCHDCGFVFTQDHPDAEHIGRYYESDSYLSHNDSHGGFSGRLYRFSRKIMVQRKKKIVSKFSGLKAGHILDIGSGSGHFLEYMRRAGWQGTGIEINKAAREDSIMKFGLNVLSPDQIRNIPAAEYDCITLWHALEHFQDPFNYASDIARLLKAGGICIAALPNCNSSDAGYYREFWAAYDVPRHLWHFTPETFRYFAEKTGFRIDSVKRLPLDVFYISALSEKYKGSKLSFILGMIKASWFFVLSCLNKQKSSSLVFLLRKSHP